MAEANVNDRSTIERAYDQATFEQDAAWNARSTATTVRGVKILSAPDAQGRIELAQAAQHVAEGNPEGDAVFVPAYRLHDTIEADGNTYSGSAAPVPDRPGEAGDDYRDFVDRILKAARNGRFKTDIGFGDDRLKGLRGG